jgi:signal peptidase I
LSLSDDLEKYEEAEAGEDYSENRSPAEKIRMFSRALFYAVLAAFILKTFVVEAFRIPTGSMEKTLLVGDFLLVNKFIYGASTPGLLPLTGWKIPQLTLPALREPERKDVVVFEYPGDRDEVRASEKVNYIKRCIGIPGDTIRIINKVVFVNHKEFFRPPGLQYVNSHVKPPEEAEYRIFPKGVAWNEDNYGPVVVPRKGQVVSLNYQNIELWRTIINRELDSEAVSVEGRNIFILGKPAKSYTVKKDYYFMMGDNRDDSADSRFWGFVPRDKFIGKAFMVYWSWDPSRTNILDMLATVKWDRVARVIH